MGRHRVLGRPAPPVLTKTDEDNVSGGSFTNQAIGAAAADRLVICIASVAQTAARFVTAATIGGVAATLYMPTTTRLRPVCIFWARVPTGTTADVVITWNDSVGTCNLITYRMTGQTSDTPVAQNFGTNTTSLSLSDVEEGAAIVIGATQATTGSVAFDPPVVSAGAYNPGGGFHLLSYGQVNDSAEGTVNLTFTTASMVAAVAWA